MEVKIISVKENPLLKRKEVNLHIKHDKVGSTPLRLEIRKAIAKALKTELNHVFVKKIETRTGTQMAVGLANVYESIDYARLVEPKYIIERNMPPQKSSEEGGE